MKAFVKSSILVVLIMACVMKSYGQLSEEELAKIAQNPIANIISLPFQNNTNFGVGPNDRTQNVTNLQPVFPFADVKL